MTPKDLENTLLTLGCDGFSQEEFDYIANTALHRIYNDVEVIKRDSIFAHGIQPISVKKEIAYSPGKSLSYPLVGKAYSVRVCGASPIVGIGTGTSTVKYLFENGVSVLKGFLTNNMGVITFEGDYNYIVYDLCLYDKVFSSDRDDIPDGTEFTVYDVTRRCFGFLSFVSQPTDVHGNPINELVAKGKNITVRSDYQGQIYFEYRRGPRWLIEYDTEEDIDIPEECIPLLPILFLAYYYVETDEDKAELYMERYRELLKSIPKKQSYNNATTQTTSMAGHYNISDGWA